MSDDVEYDDGLEADAMTEDDDLGDGAKKARPWTDPSPDPST